MIVIVLAVAGPALATFGLILHLPSACCACPECVTWRRWGWRAIRYGLALVVAAWLVAPWPAWLVTTVNDVLH